MLVTGDGIMMNISLAAHYYELSGNLIVHSKTDIASLFGPGKIMILQINETIFKNLSRLIVLSDFPSDILW
jgi:hypothetical protein